MPFLACLPLIEADIPAVLALDQRCLGGLWTRSGYLKELESDRSDLLVLLSDSNAARLKARAIALAANHPQIDSSHYAASNANASSCHSLQLLGIGCLWAIVEEAHITTLAIEPAQQRRKLGQLLLSELLLHGHRRELTRATLEVRVSNENALGLYQSFGFREAGQRRRYYSDGENARVLWRSGLQDEMFVDCIGQKRKEAIAHLTQFGFQYLAPHLAPSSDSTWDKTIEGDR